MQGQLFKTLTRDERQEEARIKWIQNKCRGCLVQPTGCGKSVTGLKCIRSVINKYPQMRFLIVVPTDNLKTQWIEHIDNWGLSLNGSVEVINTVARRLYSVDILVIDEIHRSAADTLRRIFDTVKYKYILGLTATYERLDDKQKESVEKYCPVIDRITTQEALLNNWISHYKEYQVIIDVDDIDVYKKYNKDFIEHFEFFNFDFNLAMSMVGNKGYVNRATYRDKICNSTDPDVRKRVFKTITYHATAFMQAIQSRKKFINNHPKKIELARKIIAARPASKIITFSNNIKMAEAIGIGEVYTGKDTKKKARANLEEFNMQTGFAVLNSVAKLNEGADIRGLSVAIVLGLDSSEIKATQRRGRVIRFEVDKEAEIFNLVLDQTAETEWFKKSHKNSTYITIDEEGLEEVLAGREPKPYTRKIKDFTFRF